MDRAKTPEELADGVVAYVRKADGVAVVRYLASLEPDALDALLREYREPTQAAPEDPETP